MSQFGLSCRVCSRDARRMPIARHSGRESRMTLSKVEATFCERELGELVRTSSGVETALIATGDGFEVASVTRRADARRGPRGGPGELRARARPRWRASWSSRPRAAR